MFTFNLPKPFARNRTHVPQQISFCESTGAIFMVSAGEIWKAFCADIGKRCSWEHVGPLRLASQARKQGAPMPAALMVFRHWRHMHFLHQLTEAQFFNWLCSLQITHMSKASLLWPPKRFQTGGVWSNPASAVLHSWKSVFVRRWRRVNIKVMANLLMRSHSGSIFCWSTSAKTSITTPGLRHCSGNDGQYYSSVIAQIHSWRLEYLSQ